MNVNIASWDRIARVVLGIILFVLGLTGVVGGAGAWVMYVLGLVMFGTAAMGFCPIYKLINFSTKK